LDLTKNPKVSVIIPTFNRKGYVCDAIDSVLNQTYRDFEIIVVDDGSTDGTGETLREKYGEKIRYYSKENGGCATARNFGIRVARGEYITFLDSDDTFMQDKLETQVGILEKNHDSGLVYSDSFSFDGQRRILIAAVKPDRDQSVTFPLFMTTFMGSGSFTVRRKYLDEAGYFDESMRYNEDTDFLLRLAVHAKAYRSDKPSYVHRDHSGGKSRNTVRLLEALYDSSAAFLTQHPAFRERLGKNADRRLAQIRLDLFVEHMLNNDPDKALAELETARRLYPSPGKSLYRFLLRSGLLRFARLRRAVQFVETARKIIISYRYCRIGLG
jgi:glycosyltransferase involved in cell wall biosynthesis